TCHLINFLKLLSSVIICDNVISISNQINVRTWLKLEFSISLLLLYMSSTGASFQKWMLEKFITTMMEFKEQLIYAAFNHTSERESKLNRMLEFVNNDTAEDFISKKNLYEIRCWFWKSIEVTSRMVQDNKRKDSTQCSILENVFLYLIIDLYFIFFIILGFAYSFPCFIFSFGVKFSVGSISFCLVVNGFSFSFMNSPLTISGMM
uniref:Uncharacterized protein n=1 Tax=Strongyloides stercoralis TaxID=6248 RepID=A0AAF5DF59_STRER